MKAMVGDRLHIHRNHVGVTDTMAEIVEVHGEDGAPPYVCRFPDGHVATVYPGPDAVVEQAVLRPVPH
ncbi:DUF1918 domain-containing protein [Actinomadura oligospora]|uniref:DUF1918 domain-containing protein n=1 Tax=Actinomadura oligospora TaxID=111804 RepID=UPI00047ECACD|nr:DUF1918 domain-containing protein [Actinomadura oligospora]